MDKNTVIEETGVAEAIRRAGGQGCLSRLLGCSQQNVSAWAKQGYVPVGRVVEVEQGTGVPRARLINPKVIDILDVSGL